MAIPVTLKVYRGEELVRSERFLRDIIKIGRIASAHLCLEDDRVSRIHSVIEVGADGLVSIIDMGSAEGTFVNGRRVSKGPLQPGDEIKLGGLRIVFGGPEGVLPEVNRALAAPASAVAPEPREPARSNGHANGHAVTRAVIPAAPPSAGEPYEADESEQPAAALPAPVRAEPRPAPAARSAAAAGAPHRGGRAAAPSGQAAQAVQAVQAAQAARAVAPAPAPAAEPRPRRAAMAVARPVEEEAPSAGRAASGDEGIELRVLWGDTLLDAGTFVAPRQPVLMGEGPRCHFRLSAPDLPTPAFPILRHAGGEYRFLFPRGMRGGVQEKPGAPIATFEALVKARRAEPDDAVDGAFAVAIPRRGAVRGELGSGLRVEARFRRPPPQAIVPWWERIDYRYLNLLLVLLFLQGGFIVAAKNTTRDVDLVQDDLAKGQQRMAKFVLKPAEAQPKVNPYLEKLKADLKREQPGEMAEKHKGDEGQMGRKDAPKTNGRSAPKAIDPRDKELVKHSGLLAAFGKGPGTGGLSTVFGKGGLGGDIKGAIGNMFGPVVGDSRGVGGLGLKGTGPGGGGQGETIGIGAVGTKGRGGGLGGYGTGVGGLGAKRDRDVSVATGDTKVLGAIDPELVRKVIRDHADQVRYCYEQQLTLNPKLTGKVAIRWQINSNGFSSNTVIDRTNTTPDAALDRVAECIMSRIVTWEFPKPKGGGIAIVTYPWILRSAGSAASGG